MPKVKKITSAQKAKIRRLHKQGLSERAIARKVKVSRSSVNSYKK